MMGCQFSFIPPSTTPRPTHSVAPSPIPAAVFPVQVRQLRQSEAEIALNWPPMADIQTYEIYLGGERQAAGLTAPTYLLNLQSLAPGSYFLLLKGIGTGGKSRVLAQSQVQNKPNQPVPTPSPSTIEVVLTAAEQTSIEKYGVHFGGRVFDDDHRPLDGVLIQVRSLNPRFPFQFETLTVGGKYTSPPCPTGIQYEITARKTGYTTRRRVEVIRSGGDPSWNERYDFGQAQTSDRFFSAAYNSLSDKPEVLQVYPARNGSKVSPQTFFKLWFSEPMQRSEVEAHISVRAFKPIKFSVDQRQIDLSFNGNGTIASNFQTGSLVWDGSAFDFDWNADQTEVVLHFKNGKLLPSDRYPFSEISYNIAFTGEQRVIRDKAGLARREKHFKLTDGDFEESYQFGIQPDSQAPKLLSLSLFQPLLEKPQLLLQFSEPLLISTQSLALAGGLGKTDLARRQAPAEYPDPEVGVTAAQAAQNYTLKVRDKTGKLIFAGSWAEWGGEAYYAPWDKTFKTVQLLAGPETPLFAPGAQLSVDVASTVVDPAGNPIDPTSFNASLVWPE